MTSPSTQLAKRGDPRVIELQALVKDDGSWLAEVKRIRDRVTHRTASPGGVVFQGGKPVSFFRFDGGGADAKGKKAPRPYQMLEGGPEHVLSDAFHMMELLVQTCRS